MSLLRCAGLVLTCVAAARVAAQPAPAEVLKGRLHSQAVSSVALSADGAVAVTGSEDMTARVWSTKTGETTRVLHGHQNSVYAVALSSDGQRVVTGAGDWTARVWDSATGGCLQTLEGHSGEIWGVALSADGKVAVTASKDRTARVWDATTGKYQNTFKGHTGWVAAVAVTADGALAVTGSFDGTAVVWETATGRVVHTLRLDLKVKPAVKAVALTPDGKWALTGSDDKIVRVWDLKTATCTWELKGHTDDVRGVALTADGKIAVSAAKDGSVRVWDLATGKESRSWQQEKNYRYPIWGVGVSGDGRRAAAGWGSNRGRVWNLQSGDLVQDLGNPTTTVVVAGPSNWPGAVPSGGAPAVDPEKRRAALALAAEVVKADPDAVRTTLAPKLKELGRAADDAVAALIVAAYSGVGRVNALEAIEVARPGLFPLVRKFTNHGDIGQALGELSQAEAAAVGDLRAFDVAVRSLLLNTMRPGDTKGGKPGNEREEFWKTVLSEKDDKDGRPFIDDETLKAVAERLGRPTLVPRQALPDYWAWTLRRACAGDEAAVRAFRQILAWSPQNEAVELKTGLIVVWPLEAGLPVWLDGYSLLAAGDPETRTAAVRYAASWLGRPLAQAPELYQRANPIQEGVFAVLRDYPAEALTHRKLVRQYRFTGEEAFQKRVDALLGVLEGYEAAAKKLSGKRVGDLVPLLFDTDYATARAAADALGTACPDFRRELHFLCQYEPKAAGYQRRKIEMEYFATKGRISPVDTVTARAYAPQRFIDRWNAVAPETRKAENHRALITAMAGAFDRFRAEAARVGSTDRDHLAELHGTLAGLAK